MHFCPDVNDTQVVSYFLQYFVQYSSSVQLLVASRFSLELRDEKLEAYSEMSQIVLVSASVFLKVHFFYQQNCNTLGVMFLFS